MLNLIYYPDPILEQVAEPVIMFDSDFLSNLTTEMFALMKAKNGIGLAAPQVGISKRIFVTEIDNAQIVFINPEITESYGETAIDEGCLSFPGIKVKVQRKATITIKAQRIDGASFPMTMTGLASICFQHELDHLDGKTFIDYLSKDIKVFLKRRLEREKNE